LRVKHGMRHRPVDHHTGFVERMREVLF
jgi:hypothetical protein